MRRLLTLLVITIAALAALLSFAPVHAAGGFTLGDLVVVRFGDGAAALGSAATAAFLDEYTTAGGLVQSIPLPTTASGANRRFTVSGTATSEGQLSQSTNGQFLVVAGYDAALGTASITTSTSATVNRVIARADSSGSIDTTTALTDAISGGNPRGAASTNGTDLWISGTSSGGGIRYAALGASTSTSLSTTVTNLRHTAIFGGQLFVTSASGTFRLAGVGTGTPTTTGQTITNLAGITTPASPYGFFFADLSSSVAGVDTVYIADDSTGAGGGILKFSLVSGTWVANGNISSSAALRGLTGVVNSNGSVTLYAGGTTALVTMTDTAGYNAAITGALSTIASSGTNKQFRGVAFTPSNSQAPQPTNPTGTGTANPSSVQAGTSTLLTVAVTPGQNPTTTSHAVTADLTPIGGSATQAFIGNGNSFTFTALVPAATQTGLKTITATITDAENRPGTATISLTVTAASTAPTGTGTATPSSVVPGNSTLLSVAVTPGSNPASSGIVVTGDLSAIGGSSTQAFAANGNNFTFTAAVPAGTPYGPLSLPVTISDAQSRNSAASIAVSVSPPTPPTTLKISQVYGGGGNSGATYTNDFIELFNDDGTSIDVTGWSVQYNGATANGAWAVTPVCSTAPCVIQPWHYFLVQEAAGNAGTTPLPMPNAVGVIPMSLSQGKVALVNSTIAIVGACPAPGTAADLVGYGSANCAEGATAPTLTNTTAALRRINGCQDTDNNNGDFVAVGPIPRNSLAPENHCGTDLYGLGIATPDAVDPAAETLLTVRVTPGANPPSTSVKVAANLSTIGGSPAQSFYDDRTHGDQVAGDGTFSYLATTAADLATGAYSSKAVISDNEGRSATAPITMTITSPTCGVERWAVKVGTDAGALGGAVRLDIPATPAEILDLVTRPAPAENDLNTIYARARVPGDVESTVFSIDATLTFYKHEDDVDYHMVLDDGAGHTLIAEIPSPACVLADGSPRVFMGNAPFWAGISRARATFDARLSATTFFQTANIPVRVKGVGFFDFEHGQTGVAPNAIELHPVLDIFFRANTTTTLLSSGTAVYGEPMTFTATVTTGGENTPTGDVTFFDSSTGSSIVATLDANGAASFSSSALAAGAHSIIASYPGDDTSLPSASATLALTIARASQSIAFAPLADKTFGAPPFTVSASGGASGNPVTFSASGDCTSSGPDGSTITLTTAGSCTVTASQAGDANYDAAASVSRTFAIVDGRAPVIVRVAPSVASIWPPNKNMIGVSILVTATDDVDPSPVCSVTGVSSNEPEAGDSAITGPLTVSLRADRNGNGSGRVYTIGVRCVDASGNASTSSTMVTIPHDQRR